MGECCVVVSSELLDSLVFPVSLHSVILRSSTYNDIYNQGYIFLIHHSGHSVLQTELLCFWLA